MLRSPFIFTVCQTGAEAALKKELARTHPELRFAYSRPGFVTFKSAATPALELPADFELKSVFARAYGLSAGKASTSNLDSLLEYARCLNTSKRRPRLHVWERDQHFPGDEPLGFEPGQWAAAARQALAKHSELFEKTATPKAGDIVLDVVAVESDEWWYGCHTHSPAHSPAPGGRPEVVLPEEAPSRAYTKLEEALFWSAAPVRKGDIAVEIGSAPGGASYALLKRGLQVVGIDPGEMHPIVLKNPDFVHIKNVVAQVSRETLPPSIQWLLLDMNVEPRISVYAVDRLVTRTSDSLLGVFLTIKLNQWRIADEIPSIMEHVKAMGMVRVRATQLASNRQEILIYGLTRKGLVRTPAA
jgi:23S rRNA (cytidine2498-2'-O)-methyltransferase